MRVIKILSNIDMPKVKSELSPLDYPLNATPQRRLSIGNTWDVLPDPSCLCVCVCVCVCVVFCNLPFTQQ